MSEIEIIGWARNGVWLCTLCIAVELREIEGNNRQAIEYGWDPVIETDKHMWLGGLPDCDKCEKPLLGDDARAG